MKTLVKALYTRADYLQLPEGFPAQLIRGHLVKERAPTYGHQGLLQVLLEALWRVAGRARTLPSPVDVPIDEHNVYQPDVAVFRDPPPPDETCTLVPILVVEIASPSTRVRDRGVKRRGYLAAGVAEVWVVDREERTVEVYSPSHVQRATGKAPATSSAVPGFALVPDDLFA